MFSASDAVDKTCFVIFSLQH